LEFEVQHSPGVAGSGTCLLWLGTHDLPMTYTLTRVSFQVYEVVLASIAICHGVQAFLVLQQAQIAESSGPSLAGSVHRVTRSSHRLTALRACKSRRDDLDVCKRSRADNRRLAHTHRMTLLEARPASGDPAACTWSCNRASSHCFKSFLLSPQILDPHCTVT